MGISNKLIFATTAGADKQLIVKLLWKLTLMAFPCIIMLIHLLMSKAIL